MQGLAIKNQFKFDGIYLWVRPAYLNLRGVKGEGDLDIFEKWYVLNQPDGKCPTMHYRRLLKSKCNITEYDAMNIIRLISEESFKQGFNAAIDYD